MTPGPVTLEELSQDLVLAMRNLEPLLVTMLAVLQNADPSAEKRIDAMTTVMVRVASGLDETTRQLQALGANIRTQEKASTHLSGKLVELVQRLDREERGRAALNGEIQNLLTVLTQ